MKLGWWFDSIVLFALIPLIVATYQLSKRVWLESGTVKSEEAWKLGEKRWPRIYPAQRIRHAGLNPEHQFSTYWALKAFLLLLGPLLTMELIDNATPYWKLMIIGLAGFIFPDVCIYTLAKNRKQKIQNSVSYFTDLLVAFLKSGMSLAQAFDRAAQFGLPKSNPLTKEVKVLAGELEFGLGWQLAFSKLAKRTGVNDLQRIAMIMKVGHSTGVPVVDSLSSHAELLREKQKERVNAILNRKSIEALIPTLLLSVPMFLVLVFFPTGVQIYDAFQLFTSSW